MGKNNKNITGGYLTPIIKIGKKSYYKVNSTVPGTDKTIINNKVALDNEEIAEVNGNTLRVGSNDLHTTDIIYNLANAGVPFDKAFDIAFKTQESFKDNIGLNDDGTMKANKGGKISKNLFPYRGIGLGYNSFSSLLNKMARNKITDYTRSPFIPNIKRKQTGGEDYSVRFNEFEAQNKDTSKDKVSKVSKLPKVNFKGIKTTRNRPYNPDYISFINDALVKNNVNLYQRASILANIIEESGGDPFADSGTGFYGLLQWANDRYKYNGEKDVYKELQNQTDYIISTMNNTDDKVSWTHGGKGSGYNSYKDAMAAFNGEDINGVMHGYTLGYVRPTGKQDSYNNRLKVYNQLLGLEGFKTGGIYIKPNKKGTFTTVAKQHGKSVQEFATQVLNNKENYSPSMIEKANFARNASKWNRVLGGISSLVNGGKVNPSKGNLVRAIAGTKIIDTNLDISSTILKKMQDELNKGNKAYSLNNSNLAGIHNYNQPSNSDKLKLFNNVRFRNFFSGVGNWFTKPKNQLIAGSVADAVLNVGEGINTVNAINNLQAPSVPNFLNVPNLLTNYNINASRSALSKAYGDTKSIIDLNTASSAVKQARMRNLADKVLQTRLGLEEQKLNNDVTLINQNKALQSQFDIRNNEIYNNYLSNKTAFENQKLLLRSQAISDTINSIGQSISGLIGGLNSLGTTNTMYPNGVIPLNLANAYNKVNNGVNPIQSYMNGSKLFGFRCGGKKKTNRR